MYNMQTWGLGHRSIAPGFKPRLGYVRRVFHLSLHLITFGGHSSHLAYLVHKSGRKTATFTHMGSIPFCQFQIKISNSIFYLLLFTMSRYSKYLLNCHGKNISELNGKLILSVGNFNSNSKLINSTFF